MILGYRSSVFGTFLISHRLLMTADHRSLLLRILLRAGLAGGFLGGTHRFFRRLRAGLLLPEDRLVAIGELAVLGHTNSNDAHGCLHSWVMFRASGDQCKSCGGSCQRRVLSS